MGRRAITGLLDIYGPYPPDMRILNPYALAPVGGFAPTDIAGCVLWLSDTGADASVWPDLSGEGNDAVQADAGKQPAIIAAELNGRQVRRFDGTDDGFSLSSPLYPGANWTVFQVIRKATGTARMIPLGNGALNEPYPLLASLGVTYISNHVGYHGTADTDTAWGVWVGRNSANTLGLWKGGAALTLSGMTPWPVAGGWDKVGKTNDIASSGDIAEIIIYDSALSDPNREAVEAYLTAKWGL